MERFVQESPTGSYSVIDLYQGISDITCLYKNRTIDNKEFACVEAMTTFQIQCKIPLIQTS